MRINITCFIMLISIISKAQIKSGIIKYELVTNLAEARLETQDKVPEALLAMFPKVVKKVKQLRFTESKSMFENIIKTNDENGEQEPPEANGGASFGFKQIGTSANITDRIFIDLIADIKLERQTFYDKSFVIKTDSIKNINWKPTGKQKLILNYPCYEAIRIDEVQNGLKTKIDTIKAWYTPEIEAKTGPMGYCNLPGMILQLQYGSSINCTATEVVSKELIDTDIEEPKDGKKVLIAEYKELRAKRMKEMKMQNGKPRVIYNSSSETQ